MPEAEIYDPDARAFRSAGSMIAPRFGHTSSLLPDGTVLIAGGWDANGSILASVEVFDPSTGVFRPLSPMREARAGHVMVVLADGRVLFLGGVGERAQFLASAETYDPRTGRFATVGPMAVARENHAAVRLADGRVLVCGGHVGRRASQRILDSAELFDPASDRFIPTGSLGSNRHKHDAVLMRDGRVLITGGASVADERNATSEFYDPTSGTSISARRCFSPTAPRSSSAVPPWPSAISRPQIASSCGPHSSWQTPRVTPLPRALRTGASSSPEATERASAATPPRGSSRRCPQRNDIQPFHPDSMKFLRRLRFLFRRRLSEAEMAEEMRYHLEQRTAEKLADGLSPEEAHYAAQRKFGNTAVIQERAREARGWGSLERFGKDLQFATRQLIRSPGFTILAVVTLGLGIGANTSMFSLINGIVLKPLPYANLDRLERIWRATPQFREGNFSSADFLALREAEAAYGEFAGYRMRAASIADPGAPAEFASSAQASVNLFSVLGVHPELGRAFRADESIPGRDKVVLLSQRVWRNRYGARADILGRSVRIDGEPHEVVGVLSAAFNDWRYLGNVDFFRPLALTPELAENRREQNVRVIGLRSPAADSARAARRAREHPAENAGTSWWSQSLIVAAYGSPATLSLLIALSGFVLVLACANLANLYLVRTIARTREFAVRAALGASRLQLTRPLVAESLLLSAAGGALALLVVEGFHEWTRLRSTGDNGEQVVFLLDPTVVAWSVAVSLLTALAFGLMPALYARRVDLNDALKSGARGSTGGRGAQRFRRVLVVGQFALALVLLSGAAIFIRGLDDLHTRRGGWDASRLVTGAIALPAATYKDDDSVLTFQRLALERLHSVPGVEAAALAKFEPYFYWSEILKLQIDGQQRPAPGSEPAARLNTVGAGYFSTVGTKLIAGRVFGPGDTAAASHAYIVSQSTARALFGGEHALGRRIAPATDGAPAWGEIVGIVADVENVEPDANTVAHQVYRPLAQHPQRGFELLVRVQGVAPSAVVPDLRAAITGLDPDLPVRSLRPAQTSIERSLYQLGVLRDMLAAFGILGLALAALGIYGVIARTMAQRTGEFAIRLALGASARQIARLVFASGARLAVIGSVLGLVGAVGVARVLTSNYPGIRANSPLILAFTTVFLLAVALVACWLPARRAGKIDAMRALRAE